MRIATSGSRRRVVGWLPFRLSAAGGRLVFCDGLTVGSPM